jgi:hypothetical protein
VYWDFAANLKERSEKKQQRFDEGRFAAKQPKLKTKEVKISLGGR